MIKVLNSLGEFDLGGMLETPKVVEHTYETINI